MKRDGVVMVICKQPVAGRVKTRMCPPLSEVQAADLAAAALVDTFAACSAVSASRYVAVCDGDPSGWVPSNWFVVAQRTGGLDVRLADAFEDVLLDGEAGVLVAMDTPQATAEQIDSALQLLSSHDAVIGLTEDGGYWLIGLAAANRLVFEGVPMSTDHTGAKQVDRLQELGLSFAVVERLRDLDEIDDVAVVADQFPNLQISKWWKGIQR
jgi:rSAM/selenodomain-associated transferase 1